MNVVKLEAFDNWLQFLALVCIRSKQNKRSNQVLVEKIKDMSLQSERERERNRESENRPTTRDDQINKRSRIRFCQTV